MNQKGEYDAKRTGCEIYVGFMGVFRGGGKGGNCPPPRILKDENKKKEENIKMTEKNRKEAQKILLKSSLFCNQEGEKKKFGELSF